MMDLVELPTGQVDPRLEPYSSWILVAPDHMESGTGRLLQRATAKSQIAISGKYAFSSGDVLYSKIRPYLRKAVLANFDGLCSADVYPLRPRQDVHPSFLLALILSEPFSAFAESVSMRSGFPKINRNELAEYRAPVPPFAEQTRIAEVLDTLDEAIRRSEAIKRKRKVSLDGLVSDLMTFGLTEGGAIRAPHLFPNEFEHSILGRTPMSWRVGPLGNFITLQRGFDITQQEQRDGIVPVVSSSGITSYHDRAMVQGPGVVIGRKGKLGGAHYLTTPFWPHDTTLWVKDFHGNDPEFCAHFLRHLRLERFDAATSVPTLNRNFVHPVPVALPLREEQERICKVIRAADDDLNREVELLGKLKLLKFGLTSDLLTGRIRTRPH
jgi:type I restriction enzyme S subunit